MTYYLFLLPLRVEKEKIPLVIHTSYLSDLMRKYFIFYKYQNELQIRCESRKRDRDAAEVELREGLFQKILLLRLPRGLQTRTCQITHLYIFITEN